MKSFLGLRDRFFGPPLVDALPPLQDKDCYRAQDLLPGMLMLDTPLDFRILSASRSSRRSFLPITELCTRLIFSLATSPLLSDSSSCLKNYC